MKTLANTGLLALVAALSAGQSMARDVEPPFTWEGKGHTSIIDRNGIEEVDFQFELSLDERGMVQGNATTERVIVKIHHLFYTEEKKYEFPGFFTRNLVIVLIINEEGEMPMLAALKGRLLMDRFFYGEVLLARYEAGSEKARALGIGDPRATLMAGDELPGNLKSALNHFIPLGTVKIEGGYRIEPAERKEQ